MSDTPRTDAEESRADEFYEGTKVVSNEIARHLERDLTEQTQRGNYWSDLYQKAGQEILELRKENDVLRQWHKEAVAQCLSVTDGLTELRRDLACTENARVALLAELENARKDAARMNLVESKAFKTEAYDRFPGYHWEVHVSDPKKHKTLRAALDAVIAKEKSNG